MNTTKTPTTTKSNCNSISSGNCNAKSTINNISQHNEQLHVCNDDEDDVDDDMSWILDSKKYVVNRRDVRRSEDLHYAYVDFDPEAVSSKC